MKCPHCQMDDVLVSTSSELRLLSFVFNTISCPHCSGVYAIPKSNSAPGKNKPPMIVPQSRIRNAA